MRVAFISYHTSPLATLGGKDTGGMNVFVRETAREMARRGILVDVYVRKTSPDQKQVDDVLAPGVRVIHVSAGPPSAVAKAELRKFVPEFVEQVCEFSHAEATSGLLKGSSPPDATSNYDVVHAHYWLSGLAAEQLTTCWGAKFVQTFHTLAELKNQVALRPEDMESDVRVQAECHLCERADRITAATQVEWSQLVHLYGAGSSRIRIVPPGVDISVFNHVAQSYARQTIGVPVNVKLILFAGRIEPLKGIDTLFQAIAELRTRELKWFECKMLQVAIIGGDPSEAGQKTNPEMARLINLRRDLHLDDVITFEGAQNQDSLHDYFNAADCVVMPSHYESFGMVALEAMACGTPVIASDVGGLSKLVRDEVTGLLFEARDHMALADEIALLLGDEAFRRTMGHRAECYAADYSWQRIVDKLVAVYAEVSPKVLLP